MGTNGGYMLVQLRCIEEASKMWRERKRGQGSALGAIKHTEDCGHAGLPASFAIDGVRGCDKSVKAAHKAFSQDTMAIDEENKLLDRDPRRGVERNPWVRRKQVLRAVLKALPHESIPQLKLLPQEVSWTFTADPCHKTSKTALNSPGRRLPLLKARSSLKTGSENSSPGGRLHEVKCAQPTENCAEKWVPVINDREASDPSSKRARLPQDLTNDGKGKFLSRVASTPLPWNPQAKDRQFFQDNSVVPRLSVGKIFHRPGSAPRVGGDEKNAPPLPSSCRPHTIGTGLRDLGLNYSPFPQAGGSWVADGALDRGGSSTRQAPSTAKGSLAPKTSPLTEEGSPVLGNNEANPMQGVTRSSYSRAGVDGGGGGKAPSGSTKIVAHPSATESYSLQSKGRTPAPRFNQIVLGQTGLQGLPGSLSELKPSARDGAAKGSLPRLSWEAPRGRVVKGAVVGLTAEALSRPAIALDSSGRAVLTEQHMVAFDEVWPVDVPALRPICLHITRPCAKDARGNVHLMPMHLHGAGIAGREGDLFNEPPPLERPGSDPRDRKPRFCFDEDTDGGAMTGGEGGAQGRKRRWRHCKLWRHGVETWHSKWSAEDQVMLGRLIAWRGALLVSFTYSVVTVYGLGMAGRVLVEGAQYPRGLLVEAYSVTNSYRYTLRITMEELEELFANEPDKLGSGKKADMVDEFVKMLYFDYTVGVEVPHASSPGGFRVKHETYADREPWTCLKERRSEDLEIHWADSRHHDPPQGDTSHPAASAPLRAPSQPPSTHLSAPESTDLSEITKIALPIVPSTSPAESTSNKATKTKDTQAGPTTKDSQEPENARSMTHHLNEEETLVGEEGEPGNSSDAPARSVEGGGTTRSPCLARVTRTEHLGGGVAGAELGGVQKEGGVGERAISWAEGPDAGEPGSSLGANAGDSTAVGSRAKPSSADRCRRRRGKGSALGSSSSTSELLRGIDEKAVWVTQRLRISKDHNLAPEEDGEEDGSLSSLPSRASTKSKASSGASTTASTGRKGGTSRSRGGGGGGRAEQMSAKGRCKRMKAFNALVVEHREVKRQAEAEKEARLRAWLAIKKRLRGLMMGTVTRVSGQLMTLMAYEFPDQPGNIRLELYHPCTGSIFPLGIGVGVMRSALRVKAHPSEWTLAQKRRYCLRTVRLTSALVELTDSEDEAVEGVSVVRCLGRDSVQAPTVPHRSVTFPAEQPPSRYQLQQQATVDHRSMSWCVSVKGGRKTPRALPLYLKGNVGTEPEAPQSVLVEGVRSEQRAVRGESSAVRRSAPRTYGLRPRRECHHGIRCCGGVYHVQGRQGIFTMVRANWAGATREFTLDWYVPEGFLLPPMGAVTTTTTFTLRLTLDDLGLVTHGSGLLQRAEAWSRYSSQLPPTGSVVGHQEQSESQDLKVIDLAASDGGADRQRDDAICAFLPETEEEAWSMVARAVLAKCYWMPIRQQGGDGIEYPIISRLSESSPMPEGGMRTDLMLAVGTCIYRRVMKVPPRKGSVQSQPMLLLVAVSQWHDRLVFRCYDFLTSSTREAKRDNAVDAALLQDFKDSSQEMRNVQLQVALADLVVTDNPNKEEAEPTSGPLDLGTTPSWGVAFDTEEDPGVTDNFNASLLDELIDTKLQSATEKFAERLERVQDAQKEIRERDLKALARAEQRQDRQRKQEARKQEKLAPKLDYGGSSESDTDDEPEDGA